MITYEEFLTRLASVRERIDRAARAAGREPSSITLLPITKNHPATAVEHAARAGLTAVGENRVQEAAAKRAATAVAVRWELVGHLQSNKARSALAAFDRIQSVDTTKLARLLDRAADEADRTLPVLLQINAGDDPAKFGADRADAPALLEAALALPRLRVEGLMTIAPLGPDDAATTDLARLTFDRLRQMRDDLEARFKHPLPELSMGMTGDLDAAVAAGSTCVRVGTALYGQR